MERLIVDYLEPFAERLDGALFRDKYVYVEQADDALRKHMTAWDKIYKNFSGEENTPLEDRTMSYKEWNALCDAAGLDEEGLTERNMKLSYVSSLYYCSDIFDDSNDFKKMTKNEFLECLVRAAYSMHRQRLLRTSDSDADILLDASASESQAPPAALGAGSTVSALSMGEGRSMSVAGVPSMDRGDGVEPVNIDIHDFVDILDTIASKRAIQKKRK